MSVLAKCRNCGAQVNIDEVTCRVCGIYNPVIIKEHKTIDLTTTIDPVASEYELYDTKSRKVAFIYFVTLGIFGAGFFYLKKTKRGIIWLITNVFVIAGLTILGALTNTLPWWAFLLISLGVFYLINLGFGLYYLLASDVRDGYDQFLE